MATVVTFGEIMMRLATPGHTRFAQAPHLEVTFGGGEANVATALALFGVPAAFVTALPSNDWGDRALTTLRGFGVDVAHVRRGAGRMGVYFLESGAGPRASRVIYDRADAAVAKLKAGDVRWDDAFAGAKWFHFTGITPALGDGPAALCAEACAAAKRLGVTVSCDLNYRKNLWSKAKAGEVMATLMPRVDVLIANEEDAESVFGIRGAHVESGTIERDVYADVARQLGARFGFKQVAITLRESTSASRNGWAAMLFENGVAHFSRRYDLDVVDRVGGGDSFAAGLIYARLKGWDAPCAVEWAVAASALKHTVPGDLNLVTAEEVDRLAGGDASGRVQR